MSKKKVDPFMIDDDNPEWTTEDFRRARPIQEIEPPEFFTGMAKLAEERRKKLGRPTIGETAKVHVGFRLSADVVNAIRALGRGYNARVDAALRRAFIKRNPTA